MIKLFEVCLYYGVYIDEVIENLIINSNNNLTNYTTICSNDGRDGW